MRESPGSSGQPCRGPYSGPPAFAGAADAHLRRFAADSPTVTYQSVGSCRLALRIDVSGHPAPRAGGSARLPPATCHPLSQVSVDTRRCRRASTRADARTPRSAGCDGGCAAGGPARDTACINYLPSLVRRAAPRRPKPRKLRAETAGSGGIPMRPFRPSRPPELIEVAPESRKLYDRSSQFASTRDRATGASPGAHHPFAPPGSSKLSNRSSQPVSTRDRAPGASPGAHHRIAPPVA